jgi:hypothetical protein
MTIERAIPKAPLWKRFMFLVWFTYWWMFIRPINEAI